MSKSPRNCKDACAVKLASIRILVAACSAVLFGIGVFGISDARADKRSITMMCPDEKEKKETLKVSEESVQFIVAGCFCRPSKEELLAAIVRPIPPGGLLSVVEHPFMGAQIGPGQTVKATLYCITIEQFRALHPTAPLWGER